MKPSYLAREKERISKVRMRRWARKIPDNATLAKILLSFPEKPFRRQFLDSIRPYLKFEPIPLEALE